MGQRCWGGSTLGTIEVDYTRYRGIAGVRTVFFPLPRECVIERTGACGWDIVSVGFGCTYGNGSAHCTY